MESFVEKAKARQQLRTTTVGKTDRSGLQHGDAFSPRNAEERGTVLMRAAPTRFAHDFSRASIHPAAAGTMQMKTTIGKSGDEYEQEADRIADQVMRMPGYQTQMSRPSSAPARVQTKSVRAGNTGNVTAPPIAHEVLNSPGQPLDSATRAFFEPRFGHDFSAVRVHAGAEPARAAQAVDARAYTLGRDIVFGHGEYAPGTARGSRLLAHELTHVVQQRQGVSLGAGQNGGVIQREEPGAAAAPVPENVQSDAPAESDGDKARKAVLEAAEKRLKEKTTIVSAAEIKDVREGRIRLKLVELFDGSKVEMNVPTATPMKNFTTCIEFAGQTMGDASKAVGKNAKDSQRIAALLPGILKIFNQEFGLNAQIEAFQQAVMTFNKPIAEVRARQEGFSDKKEELEGQKTGEKLHDKGIDQAIKGQDAAIRQLDSAVAAMEREQKKFEAKVKKLKDDYAVLDAQDDALIRASAPLSGHPKPGEYILLGAGAKQAYGVSTATKVSLAKGSFKHIAVFKSSEPAPSPKDKPAEKWEKWHTIDGGDIEAKATELFVCLTDLRVQFGDPSNAWSASNTMLIGWIDMDKLLAGNTGANKDSPAPAKP